MDLSGWHADLDPATLLNNWMDTTSTPDSNNGDSHHPASTEPSSENVTMAPAPLTGTPAPAATSTHKSAIGWAGPTAGVSLDQWGSLPTTANATSTDETMAGAQQSHQPLASGHASVVVSTTDPMYHHHAVADAPSTAACSVETNPYQLLAAVVDGNHHFAQQFPCHPHQQAAGLVPDTKYAAATSAPQHQAPTVASQQSHPMTAVGMNNHHLDSLTANFMLAAGNPLQQQQHVSQPSHPPISSLPAPIGAVATGAPTPPPVPATAAPIQQQQQQQQGIDEKPKPTTGTQQQKTKGGPPPFYLFDAPIELRANFMQHQRKLGIPIQQDCNSYHYGEAVNGFHPQHLIAGNGGTSGSSTPTPRVVGGQPIGNIQLIDKRHGTSKAHNSGRVKNEREQKRAQKITELIEQLRVSMEEGGWKVEIRSKFHTLSSCADYVKHMIKETSEKEESVKKLQADLDVKIQKLEEDKEARSDPESVTSSLTSTSDTTDNRQVTASTTKSGRGDKDHSGDHKRKTRRGRSTRSGNKHSDSPSNGPGDSFLIDKTVSSVSDVTESNAASSSNSGSGSGSDGGTEGTGTGCGEDQKSSSSISSEAAVTSKQSDPDTQSSDEQQEDSAEQRDETFPPEEITSLERTFEVDYEEVFNMSNIPQVIATTSGKIISYNECFLKTTGLRKSELNRMTIFSFVKPAKLSNFFEIVATALKPSDNQHNVVSESDTAHVSSDDPSNEERSPSEASSDPYECCGKRAHGKRLSDYAAMTLPCIEFPAMRKRVESSQVAIQPLHVTVALVHDENPQKRIFHCIFTNNTGTNGALGCLSSELLAALFSNDNRPEKRSRKRSQHRRHSKRARLQKHAFSPDGKSSTTQSQDTTLSKENESGGDASGGTQDDNSGSTTQGIGADNNSPQQEKEEASKDSTVTETRMEESAETKGTIDATVVGSS